ncbi:MAG: Uma2 family endonuclease [Alkalinema sp. RU_4_3]|nr:Uma2 family endonuclease [Alkalinema sp. RU_4_3]
MTVAIEKNVDANPAEAIFYPSEDGQPLAETYAHLMAIFAILSVLKQYLAAESAQFSRSIDKPGTVLSDQFLYYAKGYPRLRVAPDVMVIFNVAGGGRDNYKIWEEGEVPSIIFEVTSKGTKGEDESFKHLLYEQLGVQEYWQFDPKGEWIPNKLKGYWLDEDRYRLIKDARSTVLKLRLAVEGDLLCFYREDNGVKLLTPEELAETNEALTEAKLAAETEADRLREKLRSLGVDPDQV